MPEQLIARRCPTCASVWDDDVTRCPICGLATVEYSVERVEAIV